VDVSSIIAAGIVAAGTIIAVLVGQRRVDGRLASIEVKVDGRLEAALQKIDGLQVQLETATGIPAPPAVAGLNAPVDEHPQVQDDHRSSE
jgi:hypothetical protein